MIDEPVPTMPEMVPATRPTMRTKRKFKSRRLRDPGGDRDVAISNKRVVKKLNPDLKAPRPPSLLTPCWQQGSIRFAQHDTGTLPFRKGISPCRSREAAIAAIRSSN